MYRNMKSVYSPPRQVQAQARAQAGSGRKEAGKRAQSGSPGRQITGTMMKDQYEMAKKYLETRNAQVKLSNDIANQNLALQEWNTAKAIGETLGRESDQREQSDRHNADSGATDWITCFDPRSQRKYYYSASLKKSTWVKPAGHGGMASNAGSRSASPSSARYLLHSRMTTDELQTAGAPSRDPSPYPGCSRSDYSSLGSTSSRGELRSH